MTDKPAALSRKRPRKLTRREKIIAANAGFTPREWALAGSGERYLLLVNKATGARAYAEIDPRPETVCISVVETEEDTRCLQG